MIFFALLENNTIWQVKQIPLESNYDAQNLVKALIAYVDWSLYLVLIKGVCK
jgi:hypothetical protein